MPEQRENEIPKSSLTSPVSTDLPPSEDEARRAKEAEEYVETDRLVASGVGLVKVDGIDKRYVGLPPARDEAGAETPGGLKIHPENSTFIGISQVPFARSIEIKDPTSGEFYYPADTANSWYDCELNGNKLIPELPEPTPSKKKGAAKDDEAAAADADAKRKQDEKRKEEEARSKK